MHRYRVTNADPVENLPATVSAEAVATPTTEDPLLIEVTFTSTADEPLDFAIEPPGAFPFGTVTAENRAPRRLTESETPAGKQRVVLASPDAGEYRDGCWTATSLPSTGSATGADRDGALARLGPDESVTVQRSLLNHPENDTCYPIGVYRFEETYWAGEGASFRDDSAGVPWGFDLEISDL